MNELRERAIAEDREIKTKGMRLPENFSNSIDSVAPQIFYLMSQPIHSGKQKIPAESLSHQLQCGVEILH